MKLYNADLIRYVKSETEQKGYRITTMACAFFVALFQLMQDEGKEDPETKMRKVQYSYRELSDKLNYSYKVVCNSMQLFLKAGLIMRDPGVKKEANITYMDTKKIRRLIMLDFSKDDCMVFNMDEKQIINKVAVGVSKQECLSQLDFSEQAAIDEDIKELVHDVLVKVNDLTEEEWEDLQQYIPFEIPYSDDDTEPEED